MTSTLVYNEQTGEVKLTQSKKGGDKWNKLTKEGYKPICMVNGWNVSVFKLNK